MLLSDLLTILSILIAVIALLSEENRAIIRLKFDRIDWVLLLILVLYVHFLISYDWFRQKIEFLKNFELVGWPSPAAWAYIMTIISLLMIGWILLFGKFSKKKLPEVGSLYKSLLLKGEWSVLTNYIQKYQFKDIILYLTKLNEIYDQTEGQPRLVRLEAFNPERIAARSRADKLITELVSSSSMAYAKMVYSDILVDRRTINALTVTEPSLLAEIISLHSTHRTYNRAFVQRFYKRLLQTNNEQFREELRIVKRWDFGHHHTITDKTPLVNALVSNNEVLLLNEAWKPFGDSALDELKMDLEKETSLLTNPVHVPHQEDEQIWDTITKKSLLFYDIIVRKAIKDKVNENIHLYYCIDILKELNRSTVQVKGGSDKRTGRLVREIKEMFVQWANLLDLHIGSPMADIIMEFFVEMQFELVLGTIDENERRNHSKYLFVMITEIQGRAVPPVLTEVQDLYIQKLTIKLDEIEIRQNQDYRKISENLLHIWNHRDRHLYSAPRYRAFMGAYEAEIITRVLKYE